ncbi:hypothetical protein RFI_11613, partial [Reticulomyxa filosa]
YGFGDGNENNIWKDETMNADEGTDVDIAEDKLDFDTDMPLHAIGHHVIGHHPIEPNAMATNELKDNGCGPYSKEERLETQKTSTTDSILSPFTSFNTFRFRELNPNAQAWNQPVLRVPNDNRAIALHHREMSDTGNNISDIGAIKTVDVDIDMSEHTDIPFVGTSQIRHHKATIANPIANMDTSTDTLHNEYIFEQSHDPAHAHTQTHQTLIDGPLYKRNADVNRHKNNNGYVSYSHCLDFSQTIDSSARPSNSVQQMGSAYGMLDIPPPLETPTYNDGEQNIGRHNHTNNIHNNLGYSPIYNKIYKNSYHNVDLWNVRNIAPLNDPYMQFQNWR